MALKSNGRRWKNQRCRPRLTRFPIRATPSARRPFLQWVSYGLPIVASVLVALPIVGFLLGRRKRTVPWVRLGPVIDFPLGETRFKTFENPIREPWDGMTAKIGVYVRKE